MFDLPPAHYDHPAPHMIVRIMALSEVERLCGVAARARYGTTMQVLGCAFPFKTKCIVFLPPAASDALYRHERAHCNGWRH